MELKLKGRKRATVQTLSTEAAMTTLEDECNEQADRLLREGVIGDRGQLASMLAEARYAEREACATAAETLDLSDLGPEPHETYADGRRAAARKIRNRQ